MAGSAFTDDKVVEALEHYTPILVDGDTEKEVCKKFGVSGYPTTIFATTKGDQVAKVVGAVPKEKFLDEAEGAKKKARKGKPSKDFKALEQSLVASA